MEHSLALRKLNREHNDSYTFIEQIAQLAKHGSDNELANAVTRVQQYYNNELEQHFQHEEQTVFSPIFQQYRQHIPLATQLLKEHGYLRVLIQQMTPANARLELRNFAEVLKSHTEIEEKQLFPLVAELFSAEQLDAVLNYEPIE